MTAALSLLLAPVDPVAVEVHEVLVALEGVGEGSVLQEVLEVVELLALAARDARDVIDDQQVGMLAGEIVADGPATDVVVGSPMFAPQVSKILAPQHWLTVADVAAALVEAS